MAHEDEIWPLLCSKPRLPLRSARTVRTRLIAACGHARASALHRVMMLATLTLGPSAALQSPNQRAAAATEPGRSRSCRLASRGHAGRLPAVHREPRSSRSPRRTRRRTQEVACDGTEPFAEAALTRQRSGDAHRDATGAPCGLASNAGGFTEREGGIGPASSAEPAPAGRKRRARLRANRRDHEGSGDGARSSGRGRRQRGARTPHPPVARRVLQRPEVRRPFADRDPAGVRRSPRSAVLFRARFAAWQRLHSRRYRGAGSTTRSRAGVD